MNALTYVHATRRRLAILLAARALIWASALGLGVLAAGAALAALTPTSGPVLAAFSWLAAVAALATLGALAWRERFVVSVPRVALWIEERAPQLRYALVTAVDSRFEATLGPRLAPALAGLDSAKFVRCSVARAVLPPLALLAASVLALAVMPPAMAALPGGPVPGAESSLASELPSRLTPLHAEVTPPSYAAAVGVPVERFEDPIQITALAGSMLTLTGPGSPDGIEAWLGDSALVISPTAAAESSASESSADGASNAESSKSSPSDGWSTRLVLADSAGLLRLVDRTYSRLLVLSPVADEVPRVQLLLPARDTTLRTAEGSLVLEARLRDDHGIRAAWFEYIVSSGEGEGSYQFREGRLGRRELANARDGSLELTVPLSRFGLGPGDRLSVRAAAEDNNTWSGPSTGYSETRLIRLARPGEYDDLAIEGAPPAVDSTLMTLRYLIVLTEELDEARETMERKPFVDSSVVLGRRAEVIRDRVRVLQADETMGGLFERNPLLDTAYLALVEGASALRVAEPGAALPYLREALRVLEEYAMAERYYTRGGTPDIIVDLARVRLAGTDTGQARVRMPREQAELERLRLYALYTEALGYLERDPPEAVDRLIALQVEALGTEPILAALLGEAVAGLQAGRDMMGVLGRARQLLEGDVIILDSPPRWSGGWK